MKPTKRPLKTIIVAGDVTMDWNLAHTPGGSGEDISGSTVWNDEDRTRAYCARGGAAQLADAVEAIASDLSGGGLGGYQVRQPSSPQAPVCSNDGRFHHSYAIWSLFPYERRPAQRSVWRVSRFLGFDRAVEPVTSAVEAWKKVEKDDPDAAVVVIDDADLGYRDNPKLWPKALTAKDKKPWVVVKMSRPIVKGSLWDHLFLNHSDRLIVVMTIGDLRRTESRVSRGLSWERTAQELAWETTYNPRINALSGCAHVVVSFDTAGAVLLSSASEKPFLVFDPQVFEGEWAQKRPGRMVGYTSCLAAGIIRQVMLNAEAPDIQAGVKSGLAAARRLHLDGYGSADQNPPDLTFPVARITEELEKDGGAFCAIGIPDSVSPGKSWSILEDRYTDELDVLAEKIVLSGIESALEGVPIAHFGGLVTVDRNEIEALRSIGGLIREYSGGKQTRPLSISVFGPPGSGKSFSIKQIAKSILPDKLEVKEFNLSQFSDPADLIDALHQVRDISLKGKLPLIFWDEFDTSLGDQPYGWLRYFLAPMQDGAFQEGQITHPIGECIFVFAGGTSARIESFGQNLGEEQLKAAKVPDFVSRLKGFINILGPNPQKGDGEGGPGDDPYYVIRRAILFRSILAQNAGQIFSTVNGQSVANIDHGVLRAFLKTHRFKHGARSMESIVAMSAFANDNRFERSALPSETQLNLHVNADDFLACVFHLDLAAQPELLERLARVAHDVYVAGKKRDGWKLGPKKDEKKKTHPLLVPYEDLPERAKEDNRETVKNIPQKLAKAGYAMMPSKAGEAPMEFPGPDLEILAQYEHELWVEAKRAARWKYGKHTDEAKKLHEYLVDWDKLSKKIKEIDRDLIRGIPQILAKAGYAVVKITELS